MGIKAQQITQDPKYADVGDAAEFRFILQKKVLGPYDMTTCNTDHFALQTLRVRRVYDQKHNTLVYTAYATRFQNSVSAPSRYFQFALPIF